MSSEAKILVYHKEGLLILYYIYSKICLENIKEYNFLYLHRFWENSKLFCLLVFPYHFTAIFKFLYFVFLFLLYFFFSKLSHFHNWLINTMQIALRLKLPVHLHSLSSITIYLFLDSYFDPNFFITSTYIRKCCFFTSWMWLQIMRYYVS